MVQEELTGQTIDRFHAGLVAMLRAQFARVEAAAGPVAFTGRPVVDHRHSAYARTVLPGRSAAGRDPDQKVGGTLPLVTRREPRTQTVQQADRNRTRLRWE